MPKAPASRTPSKFRIRGATILLVFAISTVLLSSAAAFSFWEFYLSVKTFADDVALSQSNAIDVETMETDLKKQVQEWDDILLRGRKPEALDKHWTKFQQRENDVHDEGESLSQRIRDPETAKLLTQFVAAHKNMGDAYRRALQEFKNHDFDSTVGDAAVVGIDRAPTELLFAAKDRLVSYASDRESEARDGAYRAMAVSTAVFVMVAIGSVLIFFLVAQKVIYRPLARLSDAMRHLADGNFAVEMPDADRKDEVGLIAAAAQAVIEQVGATIGNIKLAANEVTSASAEISSATTNLSQRTEEQAASLEETSASMEQIAATVKNNAENARQANEFAAETSAVAERGGAVVSDAVAAMARIEESSRKISDIIGVIDEIARQTNLLALNAAVEAARAGEAGRGFAVVASEVRSLAQRSSQAAKDIKGLIVNSNSQVKDGVELVNRAGQSLDDIVASIKNVAAIVADIANASLEQSSGIEQINKALTQMDEVTQQNSALVEENAATAKTLEQQAKSMDERVAVFRVRADAARAGAATEAAGKPAVTANAEPAATPQPMPKRQPKPVKRAATGGGPVGRMQTALAAAIETDSDWKEF